MRTDTTHTLSDSTGVCVCQAAVMGLAMGTFSLQNKQVNYSTGKRSVSVISVINVFNSVISVDKMCFT